MNRSKLCQIKLKWWLLIHNSLLEYLISWEYQTFLFDHYVEILGRCSHIYTPYKSQTYSIVSQIYHIACLNSQKFSCHIVFYCTMNDLIDLVPEAIIPSLVVKNTGTTVSLAHSLLYSNVKFVRDIMRALSPLSQYRYLQ